MVPHEAPVPHEVPAAPPARALGAVRVLGIDPGLCRLGWGVIDSAGSRLSHVASGTIAPDEALPMGARLAALAAGLAAVIAAHAPDEAAVEETFVNANARSALRLGQARGVALLVPAQAGLEVAEYAPATVKKAVVGVGGADKAQVALMVRRLLPRAQPATADAADALAVAITHAQGRGAALLLAKALAAAPARPRAVARAL